ncbi:hypothetical protein [Rhizorhabdus argentea]
MDPEKKKEIVKTAIIVVIFMILGLAAVDYMIGDPMQSGSKPELGY